LADIRETYFFAKIIVFSKVCHENFCKRKCVRQLKKWLFCQKSHFRENIEYCGFSPKICEIIFSTFSGKLNNILSSTKLSQHHFFGITRRATGYAIVTVKTIFMFRAAYDLGIRYIGGCCGFEPYHIRLEMIILNITNTYLLHFLSFEKVIFL
jgi:hypothetical protein